jgi:phage tail sheath protein FI
VELAIRQANPASAAFNGASVQVVSNPALNKKHFCILAGRQANDYATSGTVHFQNHTPSGGGTTDTSAHTLLLLDADSQVNVQEYALGLVPTAITTIPNASGTTDILQLWAEQPGTNGNTLRVDVDYAAAGANRFHLTIRQYPSPAGDAMASSTVTLANLTMDQADPNYVVTAVNVSASLRAKHLTAGTANAAVLPAANGLLSGDLSGLVTADFDALRGKKIKIGVGSGTPKSATITADAAWTDGAVTSLAQLLPYLQIAIQGADSSLSQASVTVVKGKYFQIRAGKSAGVNYSPANLLQVVNQSTTDKTAELLKLTETAGATAATLTSDAPQEYALALPALGALHYAETGADGEKPGATELLGVRVKPYSGLYALENTDLFNLLCLPRAAELEDTEMTSLVSSALQYCRERRAFFLIDIPKNVSTVEAMDKWMQDHANFRDPNSAVYYPRLQQPDPVREYQLRSVGSSGTMAGLYSRIDSTRGVWKAPAGTEATLAGLSGLDAQVTDMQNGALNPLGINCFRTFPVYGMVSWGGRTSHGSDQQASDWKYIPVRRLALFLEESLFRGTKWVVFEPNDEPLWAKIRLNLNAFMTNLFRQGAFQGSTPDQAFYVKCDSDTTTQNDRNLGVVNIEVGFAPLKPAEFVVLKFQQIAGQL